MGKQRQRHEHPSCRRKRSSRSKKARLRWSTTKDNLKLNNEEFSQLQAEVQQQSEPLYVVQDERVQNEELMDLDVPAVTTTICNSIDIEGTTPIKSFIPEEVESVLAHELCIEQDTTYNKPVITGNRVVDLNYVLGWSITLQHEHSKICTSGKLYLKDETRWGYGLVSCLTFACTMCPKTIIHYTEDVHKKSKINYGFVWGTLATANTFGHTKELFSVMDIPVMSLYHFQKIEADIGEIWQDSLFSEMEEAGQQEYQLATENNDIDDDGVPFITVYLDGGWSKRSYGHSYNAASGVEGVRNKYCSVCARAANKKMPVNKHVCFRNWSSSSSAMEADIITEGFNLSVEMHGLRYKKFIADGDSSVHAKIQQNVNYGFSVQKIECTNHVVKNYGKALRTIKADTSVNINCRKQLSNKKIEELEKCIQRVIYCNVGQTVDKLKKDLLNTPYHVFQHHENCTDDYCEEIGLTEKSDLTNITTSGLLLQINSALEMVVKKSHKLIDNETNNRAELFMSILARFNAGKRLNLTQRGSFEMRSYATGLRYNSGVSWHNNPWKTATDCSPGFYFKKYIEEYTDKQKSNAARRQIVGRKQKQKDTHLPNIEYGKRALEAELSIEEMESEKSRILKQLQITEEEQSTIELNTVGQYESETYLYHKKYRLTASNFGVIVKRFDHTPCHSAVKNILYGSISNNVAMEYGKMKEPMVRQMFEEQTKIKVRECGIFIDTENFYLGASPDGITEDDGIIEIKCLFKVAQEGLTLQEACDKYKNICLKYVNETLSLKHTHNYYYQIQGQLNIAKRSKCYFIVYSGDKNKLFIETIERDEMLWRTIMIPKLKKFYENCVLPEIIRRNIPRGLKCDDPEYIKDAQKKNRINNKMK